VIDLLIADIAARPEVFFLRGAALFRVAGESRANGNDPHSFLFRVIGPLRLIFLLISGTLRRQSEWQIGESNASCGYKRA
jgi:hypothetical protein